MSIAHTRAIIDAIHDGSLRDAPTVVDPTFGLAIPQRCGDIPTEVLNPANSWTDRAAYDAMAARLADLFLTNFRKYADQASDEVLAAGPKA